jgi:hypothetical protein
MRALCRGLGWERRLRRAIAARNEAAVEATWEPWPNRLPQQVMSCIGRLVEFHEFRGRDVLDLHDMAVIIAQAAYDAGNRQG